MTLPTPGLDGSAPAADPILPVLEDSPAGAPAANEPWQVLIVDDDEDVHVATEIAMRGQSIEGRTLKFQHAYSGSEAHAILSRPNAIAVVLLDVVMETPDAGLRLARRIREELGNRMLRLILRTGQPGYAPEIETLRNFDINDYRTKSELTRERLYASLTTALRAFRLLNELVQERDELARLARELAASRDSERAAAEQRLTIERQLRELSDAIDLRVEQRTRELADSLTELDEFTRMVSHDLRGPLHGLASLSGLMEADWVSGRTDQMKRRLELLREQCGRLANLVTDLLSLAKANGASLDRRSSSMNQLAAEALQAVTIELGADATSCVQVDPMPTLEVDPALMRQVFSNLLSNAVKFTRGVERPHILVSAEALSQPNDAAIRSWTFRVRDNGPGFDARRTSELFKPFSRLHGSAFNGTGIGLALVKRVIDRHGGVVRAESLPGGGSLFSFTLMEGAT